MNTVILKQKLKLLAVFGLVLAFSLTSLFSKTNHPVYSDTNGKIAYTLNNDNGTQIYTINVDGTDQTQITNDDSENLAPHWSPDGSKLIYTAFSGGHEIIRIIDANGSNRVDLTDGSENDELAVWSPDGTKIAFSSDNNLELMNADGTDRQILTSDNDNFLMPSWKPDGSSLLYGCNDGDWDQVCSINADGSGQIQLTSDTADHEFPSWSPDGSKIVMEYVPSSYNDHLITIDPDGSNMQIIATSNNNATYPSWSPDGTKILFGNEDSGGHQTIYVINADGSDETAVTPDDGFDSAFASWQPVTLADKDNDGSANTVESAAPNDGDANGDGILDDLQSSVTSFENPLSGKYTVLQSSCTSNSGVLAAALPSGFGDGAFNYPAGLVNFTLNCSAPGATATINLYYYGVNFSPTQLLRKYNAVSHSYQTIPGVTIASVTIGGQAITKATYQIKDGGPLDQDGNPNGVIVDPVGLAAPAVGPPDTGLGGSVR